jgi:hypothetical protein
MRTYARMQNKVYIKTRDIVFIASQSGHGNHSKQKGEECLTSGKKQNSSAEKNGTGKPSIPPKDTLFQKTFSNG